MQRLHDRVRCSAWGIALLAILGWSAAIQAEVPDGFVDVRDYFPADWEASGINLQPYIQIALNLNAKVYFPGSDDHKNPLFYPTTAGLTTRENAVLQFGNFAVLQRIPSTGTLLQLRSGAQMIGGIIDGNKYAHSATANLGKTRGISVTLQGNNLVDKTIVFDSPGHGFYLVGDNSLVKGARVENAGFIEVRTGARHYDMDNDRYSADGFAIKGGNNIIRNSDAYDNIRWDYSISHEPQSTVNNLLEDIRGGGVRLQQYGFIDIEGTGAGNKVIRAVSPNTDLWAIRSADVLIQDSIARRIITFEDGYEPDASGFSNPIIAGNITLGGGIMVGGGEGQAAVGAGSPTVVGNIIYKDSIAGNIGYPPGDWSFTVFSSDGQGYVFDNILYEYVDPITGEQGPGMMFSGIDEQGNNVIVYGQYWPDDLKIHTPQLLYSFADEFPVPEPSTLILLTAVGGGMLLYRSRGA